MAALRINHVSVHARDLEESVGFYEELFGMERVPTPAFQEDVVWLRLGYQQLHVFLREDADPPILHHFGLDVDDFEAVYRLAKERGLLDGEPLQPGDSHASAGWVQMYLRDPAGNLVEVDCPDVSMLEPEIQAEIGRLEGEVAQTGEAVGATLYTGSVDNDG